MCGLALAGCSALPSGGPTAGQINGALKEDNQTGFTVVDIDSAIAATLGSLPPADGDSARWRDPAGSTP